jgi:cytochrome c
LLLDEKTQEGKKILLPSQIEGFKSKILNGQEPPLDEEKVKAIEEHLSQLPENYNERRQHMTKVESAFFEVILI